MIFLDDLPPRSTPFYVLTIILMLALLLPPSDGIIYSNDTPDTDAAVYTLCMTARPAQAGSSAHGSFTPIVDCALFIPTLWARPAICVDFGSLRRTLPVPQLILRC